MTLNTSINNQILNCDEHILVAMSGGVDSSVALAALVQAGFICTGVTMKLIDNECIGVSSSKSCCTIEDVVDAKEICQQFGCPHYVLNLKSNFKESVIDRFIDAYRSGKTPNPCLDCNRYLKFDLLLNRAKAMGMNLMATGHYAQSVQNSETGLFELHRAVDPIKDQTYFLYHLGQAELQHIVFPLGSLTKDEVRLLAQKNHLRTASKPDSQDLCFVPDGDYATFIERQTGLADTPGDFVDASGNKLGEHRGISHYTVGQRKGLGLVSTEPLFVVRIDVPSNTVIVGRDCDLFAEVVTADQVSYVSGHAPLIGERIQARLRSRHQPAPAMIIQADAERLIVKFDQPERAPTPGQSLVIYDNQICLGGGIIQ